MEFAHLYSFKMFYYSACSNAAHSYITISYAAWTVKTCTVCEHCFSVYFVPIIHVCMWRVITEHIVEKYKYSKLQNTLLHTSNMQECSNNFTKHIEMVIHWKMYFHIGSCKLLPCRYKIPKCYASSAYKPVFNSYLCAS